MIWSDKYIKPANWDFKQQIENIKKEELKEWTKKNL